MKLIIPFIFGLVLTACGGGGAGFAPTNSSTLIKSIHSEYYMSANAVQGRFKNDGNTYVLVTGNQLEKGGAVPVNIFKLNDIGGGTDVTQDILGPIVPAVSTGDPIVADFNNDGIDDILLTGFVDISYQLTTTHLFLSRPGTYHSHTTMQSTQSWSTAVADLNNDGNLDVIDANGKMWINDGLGNFTFKDHNWENSLYWMHGQGVCVGDFVNSGRKQIVITDLTTYAGGLPINDTVLFELDTNLKPVSQRSLPMPILDLGNSGATEISHDVKCRVADMNNDGLMDIVVFSRPWASARNNQWTAEGRIQILINQGNFNFVDQTNITGFDRNTDIDYFPIVTDFNGDGIPDIWSSPQLLVSNLGRWIGVLNLQSPNQQILLPVKINNKWGFVFKKNIDFNKIEIYFTKPEQLKVDI